MPSFAARLTALLMCHHCKVKAVHSDSIPSFDDSIIGNVIGVPTSALQHCLLVRATCCAAVALTAQTA